MLGSKRGGETLGGDSLKLLGRCQFAYVEQAVRQVRRCGEGVRVSGSELLGEAFDCTLGQCSRFLIVVSPPRVDREVVHASERVRMKRAHALLIGREHLARQGRGPSLVAVRRQARRQTPLSSRETGLDQPKGRGQARRRSKQP